MNRIMSLSLMLDAFKFSLVMLAGLAALFIYTAIGLMHILNDETCLTLKKPISKMKQFVFLFKDEHVLSPQWI